MGSPVSDEVEVAFGALAPGCDCIHDPEHHCPHSGACLYTNPFTGPCPCAATKPGTLAALTSAWRALQRVLREQGRKL